MDLNTFSVIQWVKNYYKGFKHSLTTKIWIEGNGKEVNEMVYLSQKKSRMSLKING